MPTPKDGWYRKLEDPMVTLCESNPTAQKTGILLPFA